MRILLLILPVLAAAVYTGVRTLSLLRLLIPGFGKRAKTAGGVIYVLFLLPIVASVLVRGIGAMAGVRNLGFVCMAIFLYLFLGCLAYEVIWGILRFIFFCLGRKKKTERLVKGRSLTRKILAGLALVTAVCVSGYGLYHAGDLKVKEYTVNIPTGESAPVRTPEKLRVVLVSDLHLGSKLDLEFVKRLAEKVNVQRADVICIAGDIFDNDYEALKQPEEVAEVLKSLNSVYGVYACLGNHDIDAFFHGNSMGSTQIARFLEDVNIHLLEDEVVTVGERFQIAGRKDRRPLGGDFSDRKSVQELLEGSSELPVLLLDHQPQGAAEAVAAGVDLLLCGHTHNGQVFPGTLIARLTAKYTYGYAKEKNTNIIVTSGAGYWGPPCRVASDSEIAVININFE